MSIFSRRFAALALCAAGAMALVASLLAPTVQGTTQPIKTIVLGVLYDQEPDTQASTRAAAAEAAGRELNEYFQLSSTPIRVQLELRETGKNPTRAVAAVQELYGQGVRLFVGPSTSEEVRAIEALPISANIVMVSPSSTAPSLGKRNANLFRLAPDDGYQSEAITSLMWSDGVRIVVPVWRQDIYGVELTDEVRRDFTALGGQVMAGTGYSPDTQDFSAVARTIGQQVRDAVALAGRDAVAVYAVTFDEITGLMVAADEVPGLNLVWWYGSDGVATERVIFDNPVVSNFAWQTAFTAPIYGEDVYVQEALDVAEIIRQQTRMAPEPYAFTTYDAVMLAGLAAARAGSSTSAQQLAGAVTETASTYFGVTGPMTLNERGDRTVGEYEYWTVQSRADELYWVRVGTFAFDPTGPGTVERSRPHYHPGLSIDISDLPTPRR
ncbi:MAG: ABC transporter substrate-binding protein [Dehalococcoidia bacterium]